MRDAKILIVEDESLIAEYLTVLLGRHGYRSSSVVTTGEEAIELALRIRPNLVLMDIKICGDIDGITTAGNIRKLMEVPIVYMTAYADSDVMAKAMETKPSGYLVKPFKSDSLIATIAAALRGGQKTVEVSGKEGPDA